MKGFLSPIITHLKQIFFPPSASDKKLPSTPREFRSMYQFQRKRQCSIVFFLYYREKKVKMLIEQIKRYHNKKIFNYLGEIIAKDILSHTKNGLPIYLVSIPQIASRKRARGYDVTKTLIHHTLSHLPGKSFLDGSDFLEHTKQIHQSNYTNKNERICASHGMFQINPKQNSSYSKNVILIDDVFTTGSSMRAAQQILEQHGDIIIDFYTIAH